MTKSKHTPGEWVAVGSRVEHPDSKIADICECDPYIFGQENGNARKRSYEEQCANARLAAAAPYMLALLKRIADAPADATLDKAIFDASKMVEALER